MLRGGDVGMRWERVEAGREDTDWGLGGQRALQRGWGEGEKRNWSEKWRKHAANGCKEDKKSRRGLMKRRCKGI